MGREELSKKEQKLLDELNKEAWKIVEKEREDERKKGKSKT